MGQQLASLRNLVASYAETPRPFVLAQVVEVSRYAASGPSFVGVDIGGSVVQAAYRDGPAPTVGQYVQVRRASSRPDAWWYALPLPSVVVAGGLLFSVVRTVGSPDALRLLKRSDTGVWTDAAHPITRAVWDRSALFMPEFYDRPEGYGDGATIDNDGFIYADSNNFALLPLARVGARVFAWTRGMDDLSYADDTHTSPGQPTDRPSSYTEGRYLQAACVNCLVSADGGATWADFTALTGVREFGELGSVAYCIHDDGAALSRSTNGGLAWTLRATQATHTPPAYPIGGTHSIPAERARWWHLAVDPLDADTLTLVDKEGFWTSFDGGATLLGPIRPGGYKLHYEGYDRFPVGLQSPTYSDYWYDDFVCADLIRRGDGGGFVAYWRPADETTAGRVPYQMAMLLGTDDIVTGGSIAIGTDFTAVGMGGGDSGSRFERDAATGDLLFCPAYPIGTTTILWRSADDGATWASDLTQATDPNGHSTLGGLVVAGGVPWLSTGRGPYAETGGNQLLWRRVAGAWVADTEMETEYPTDYWITLAAGMVAV